MFSIILPTYNERENIASLITAIHQHLKHPFELLIVDDDSPDKTWQVAEGLSKQFPSVRCIRRFGKKGLTESLKEGLAAARGENVLWMDADFSMPPEAIPQLFHSLQEYPVVIGSRYVPGGKDLRGIFFPVFLSRWFNRLANHLLGDVQDYTSGFIAARKEVCDKIALSGRHGEYCIRFLFQAKKAGYRLKEIPYECRPRAEGDSKTFASFGQALRNGKDYLWTLLSLRFIER